MLTVNKIAQEVEGYEEIVDYYKKIPTEVISRENRNYLLKIYDRIGDFPPKQGIVINKNIPKAEFLSASALVLLSQATTISKIGADITKLLSPKL